MALQDGLFFAADSFRRRGRRQRVRCVTASGGVTRNSSLRRNLAAACDEAGLVLRLAPTEYCTDNAAMIGILAERKLLSGVKPDTGFEDVLPNWQIDEAGSALNVDADCIGKAFSEHVLENSMAAKRRIYCKE